MRAKTAKDMALVPCWKVRVCMRGGTVLHLVSKTEPSVISENNVVLSSSMDLITETSHGDTVGFIDWREVSAITWRFAAADER